jgi:3-phenylpropionate/cinnamic acid dioxygenase small subunit
MATTLKPKVAAPDMTEIATFLYDEADCLDAADLTAWMDLYTEDGVYWMPASPTQTSPDDHISLFYDDRLLMSIRRFNFGDALAASMEYDVRSSHIIGNTRLKSWDAETGTTVVTSNFHVAILYRGAQELYAGRYTHTLVRCGETWKIRHKKVDLLTCDQPMKSLVIYI